MKRTAWMLVAAIAAAGVLALPAVAGKPKVKTTVTIDRLDGASGAASRAVADVYFIGFVESKRRKCERRRTVVLLRTTKADGTDRIGTDKTNRAGDWRIFVPIDVHDGEGDYVAKAKRRETRRVVCKPGRSEVFQPFGF